MTASVFPKTPPGARSFRSGAVRFGGWAWIVFAAANLVDLAWRGRDLASLIAATVMLLGSGVAYIAALRPRIVADDDGVRFHNLFRDVRMSWDTVERIEGGDAVYAHADGRRYRAFVLQTSPRMRAKAELKAHREIKDVPDTVADYVRGRTATDFTVETLREMAAMRSSKGDVDRGEPLVTWAWPAILALAVPGACAVVTLIVALA